MSNKVTILLDNNEGFNITLSEFSLELQEFFLEHYSVQLSLINDNNVLVEPMSIYENQE